MGAIVDAVTRTLDALEADPHGAVLHVPREAALADARRIEEAGLTGPLAGLPVAIKDNLVTAGIPTTAGSRMLEGWIPLEDAETVRRLRAAGAVPVAKVNLDEFSMGSSGENSAFGPTANPRAPGRAPGGSSSGSAAVVAAGTVPAALGSDTGGSIRQPAALCGVYGLKPTWGRVSRRGLIAFASSLDVVGPLARDVGTLAAVYRALAGPDPGDATTVDRTETPDPLAGDLTGLRVGVAASLCRLDGVAPVMARRLAEAAETCAAAGAVVTEVDLPDPRDAVAAYYVIAPAEASSNLARYDGVRYGLRVPADTLPGMMAASRSAGFGPEVKRRILLGTFVLAAGYESRAYRRAQALRVHLREAFDAVYADHDLLLTPVTPTPAFPLGARTRDPLEKYLADLFTVTSNLLGGPAVAVPTGEDDDGLPVGMQFLAPHWEEERLLRAAAAVERSGRWPVPGGGTA